MKQIQSPDKHLFNFRNTVKIRRQDVSLPVSELLILEHLSHCLL